MEKIKIILIVQNNVVSNSLQIILVYTDLISLKP